MGRKPAPKQVQRPNKAARTATRWGSSWWQTGSLFVLAWVILFGEFIFSDQMLYGEDILVQGYMVRAFFAEYLAAGDFPLWAPRLLGGVPTIESISAPDAFYPTSLFYLFMDAYRAVGWRIVVHVLAGGFFMYGWIRSLGLRRQAAMLGGLAWLLAPVMVTLVLAGSDGRLMVASLTPLVFWAVHSLFRAPSGRTAAGVAGAVALGCLTCQFQTAYFLFGSVGAYAVCRAVCIWRSAPESVGMGPARRALVPMGLFLGSSLLGAGIAAVQLVPAGQYVTEASRRVATTVEATPEERIAYASSWSFHPEEVVSLVVPEFVGNSNADADWGRGTYWGRNALKLNHEYLGVTVVVLAICGLFGRRTRGLRWFMAGMGLMWLLFSLGTHTPVWRIFYEIVPGISIFRVPAICIFLVSFAATTLFALGVEDLVREAPAPGRFLGNWRGRVLVGFLGLLLLALILQASGALVSIWTTVVYSDASPRSLAALAAAAPFFTRGFGLALLLACLAVTTVWLVKEGRIPITVALAALILLVGMDLGRIDRAFVRTWDFHAWTALNDNTRFLQQRRDADAPFRVADLRGNDQSVDLAMFGLDLVTGHHPNDLARYRTLLGLQGSQRRGANTRHPNVLRMLNVKYLLWPEGAAGQPPYRGAQALSSARTPSGLEAVYPYPGLDRAWIVNRIIVEQDEDTALGRILSPDFDPAREVVLTEPVAGIPGDRPDTSVAASVVWEVDEPDYRRMRVSTNGRRLLVFSENWFPGWVADVGGQPTTVHRANITLQAIEIPTAGDHVVTLRYTAPTVRNALRISIAAVLITILLFASSWLQGLPAWLRLGSGKR